MQLLDYHRSSSWTSNQGPTYQQSALQLELVYLNCMKSGLVICKSYANKKESHELYIVTL